MLKILVFEAKPKILARSMVAMAKGGATSQSFEAEKHGGARDGGARGRRCSRCLQWPKCVVNGGGEKIRTGLGRAEVKRCRDQSSERCRDQSSRKIIAVGSAEREGRRGGWAKVLAPSGENEQRVGLGACSEDENYAASGLARMRVRVCEAGGGF